MSEREDEPKSKSDEVQKLLRLIAVESAKVRELERLLADAQDTIHELTEIEGVK
jgi:hypothetical protein